MDANKPYTFDRVVRIVIGILILTTIFLLIRYLSTVLLPFLVAWLIAYILQPVVHLFQYKLKFKNRLLSVITTLLLMGGVITGIIMLISPIINNEIIRMSHLLSMYTQGFDVDSIIPISLQNEMREFIATIDFKAILNDPEFMESVKGVAPKLWLIVNNSLSFVFGFAVIFLIMLYTIFLLLDYEKVNNGLRKIIPVKNRELIYQIIDDIEAGMKRYFRGQSLVALIVGVLFTIGFYIVDLPMAIIMGIIIGILNLVPYLQTFSYPPILFLVFLKSIETGNGFGTELWPVAIVFLIVQPMQDLVLVPKIMGRVTGLKPAIILLSLSVWGALLGIVGVIIALPFTTLIVSYYKRFVLNEIKAETPVETEITHEKPTISVDL
jgi:predicted PurR-regulated permease PerM